MELREYLRFRWKVYAVLFLVGLAVIVALGSGVGVGRTYSAQALLLIRPPTAQLSVFAFDLDRYITTEIAALDADAALRSEASGTSMTPEQLKTALTASHETGSDTVTLTVTSDNPRTAVSTVNHVATAYLADSRALSRQSDENTVVYLRTQLATADAELAAANRKVNRVTTQYRQQNPGLNLPDPLSYAPGAASEQQVAISAVQQLQTELAQVDQSSHSTGLSRVLNEADSASLSAQPWRLTTLLSALVGLVLALVVIASISVVLSDRVLSVNRWESVVAPNAGPPVRWRSKRRKVRRDGVRRILTMLRQQGSTGVVTVVAFPDATARLNNQLPLLIEDLQRSGAAVQDEWLSGLATPSDPGPSSPVVGPTLLCVDLRECRVEDVSTLTASTVDASRVVAVLI